MPLPRLRIRTLMIAILVLGVLLGRTINHARVQRKAVLAIQQAGGTVYYDWRWSRGRFFATGKPFGPRWLHSRVRPEYLGDITYVSLPGRSTTNTEAAIFAVGNLPLVDSVQLAWCSASDDGLAPLANLSRLEDLDLSRNTTIGDAGLKHLAGLTRLKILNLGGTSISDLGLKNLAGLTRLEALDLFETNVSDAGLKHLAGLKRLKVLGVQQTRVTEAGVKALRRALPQVMIRQ